MQSEHQHLELEQLERAAAQQDLSDVEREHLRVCSTCHHEVQLLARLKNARPVSSVINGAMVVAKIKRRSALRYRCTVALAASLFLGMAIYLATILIIKVSTDTEQLQIAESLHWLRAQQLETGSWDVEQWGGKKRFEVGISALALMSMMSDDDKTLLPNINKGVTYLLNVQNEDGSFGEPFLGDLYNISLATLALRQASKLGIMIPEHTLEKACGKLETYRLKNGAFGYHQEARAERNLSAWAQLALSEKPLSKSILIQIPEESASTTFKELTFETKGHPLSAMQIFLEGSGETETMIKAWKRELLSKQIAQGDLAGTWPMDDQWSRVGGRIFTTGMAVLSIKSINKVY